MWSLDEDPSLRSSFMGITFLDRAPDPERFRRRMIEAVRSIEALRERVVSSPLDLAAPRWEIDPGFDLDHHLRRVALPTPGSRRQLLDLAGRIYADPLDRSRALWQFTVVEGVDGDGAALLAKMHHVLSDGVGTIRLSVAFLDLSADGDEPRPPRPDPTPSAGPADAATATASPPTGGDGAGGVDASGWFDAAAGALGPVLAAPAELRKGVAAVAGTISTMMRAPAEGVAAGVSTARSLGRQMGLTDPARSPLWSGRRSLTHHFETVSIDLPRTRAVAKALGGTVNDAYVTMMASAAGAYHRSLDTDVAELRITMPISVRHDKQAAGNAWVPARLLVPTAEMDPAARFTEVSRRIGAVRAEPSLGLTEAFAGVVRRLPAPIVARFARQQVGTVDFACSNVRGAPFDLWIAGAAVLANHPFGPTAGVAFNATVLSYRESLDLGLNCDTGAISDPALLRRCIQDAAAELHSLG